MAVPPIDLMKDESPKFQTGRIRSVRRGTVESVQSVGTQPVELSRNVCVSGAGDSLPDKEELATAHDVADIPEGADGIRDHMRLYPNKFFTFANLNKCER